MTKTTTTKRDGRNSSKRLQAAKNSALQAKALHDVKLRRNAGDIYHLIKNAQIFMGVDYKFRLNSNVSPTDIADFIGINIHELANNTSYYSNAFNAFFDKHFADKVHASCMEHARKYHAFPAYNHLKNGRCVCCGHSTSCDHTFAYVANLGRCYNSYKCTKCGLVNNVDSSD